MSSTGIFDTQKVRPWDRPQHETSQEIAFPHPFTAPPCLALGLKELDLKAGVNIRVKSYTTNITKTAATFHADSWWDTTLYSAVVSWLGLCPEARKDFQVGQFSTEEDHPWEKPQLLTSRRINFACAYPKPPKVICFLNQLDMAYNTNWRVKTYVSNVDCNGFTIHIDSWSDTTLYRGVAGWIAHPEDCHEVFSGSSTTRELHDYTRPTVTNSKTINFGGTKFSKAPSVFVALNELDIDCRHNLRVRVSTDNISTTGMTWHMDTWSDTTLYSAGISYLCFIPHTSAC